MHNNIMADVSLAEFIQWKERILSYLGHISDADMEMTTMIDNEPKRLTENMAQT